MTDEDVAAMMPHATMLAVAVAHGDPDATRVAFEHAVSQAGGPRNFVDGLYQLCLCLADLVTAAEGAHLRVVVRQHQTTAETIAALEAVPA